jgi:hypothetical protein
MGKTKRNTDYKNFVDSDKNNLIIIRPKKIVEQVKTFEGEEDFVIQKNNNYIAKGLIVQTNDNDHSAIDKVGVSDSTYENAGGTITINGSVTPSSNGIYVQLQGGQTPYQNVQWQFGSSTGQQSGTANGGSFGTNLNYNSQNQCYEGGSYTLVVHVTDSNGDIGTFNWSNYIQGTCVVNPSTSGGSQVGSQVSSSNPTATPVVTPTPTPTPTPVVTPTSTTPIVTPTPVVTPTPTTSSSTSSTTSSGSYGTTSTTSGTPATGQAGQTGGAGSTTTSSSGTTSGTPATGQTGQTSGATTTTTPTTPTPTTSATTTTSTTPTPTPLVMSGGFIEKPILLERETIIEAETFYSKNKLPIWLLIAIGVYFIATNKSK